MQILNRIMPFIIAGALIAVTAFGLVLLAYFLMIVAMVSLVLYAIHSVQKRFFTPVKKTKPPQSSGRIIDN